MVMKTAISIPDALFTAADRLAGQLGISRSELYQRAVKSFLKTHSVDGVTDILDHIYGPDGEVSTLDPAIELMQQASIGEEDW